MLKKSDLAKQFELITQQEIINYKNSLSQIFEKLELLKKEVIEIKEKNHDSLAAIDARFQQLESAFSVYKDSVAVDVKRLYMQQSDQAVESLNYQRAFNQMLAEFNARTMHLGNVRENFANVHEQIDKHGQFNKALHEHVQRKLDEIPLAIKKSAEKVKDEILNAPSEASIVRTQLEEKIDSHKVDVQGIMRELQIYKKEAFIVQKKIENIYTLIARLQEGLNESGSNS